MIFNRKSKIENPKWLGLSVIAFLLVVTGAVAQAQQPKKVSLIGYLSALDPATECTRADTHTVRHHEQRISVQG